jgi:uncharacterized protein involved in cysteine biosynthesis
MAGQRAIGFWRGFTALFRAAGRLAGLPRTWPLALVPALLFLLLEATFAAIAWYWVLPWAQGFLAGVSWLPRLLATGGSWVVAAITVVFGWLLAMFLAPALASPALERIVAIVEQHLAAPPRASLGFFAELWCGLRAMLWSFGLTLPVVVVLSLLELLLPPLAVVVMPLKLLLGAMGVAWGLFDYPLTLRGIGPGERLAFMRAHFAIVVGFGAAFSLVLWVPCLGVLLLPVGAAAATELYWEIRREGAGSER